MAQVEVLRRLPGLGGWGASSLLLNSSERLANWRNGQWLRWSSERVRLQTQGCLMNEEKRDDASVSRLWSAIILSIGAVVAAWVGVSFGRGQSVDKVTDLSRELERRDIEIAKLKEDIQEIRGVQNPSPGRSDETPSASSQDMAVNIDVKSIIRDSEELKFELLGCHRSGLSVTCDFLVTNQEKDNERGLEILANRFFDFSSRAIDDQGREFWSSNAAIGSSEGGQPNTSLPPGVPVRGWVKFDEVEADAKVFRILRIGFRLSIGIDQYRVEFPDIPLGKS
jgi:hypothetical protein